MAPAATLTARPEAMAHCAGCSEALPDPEAWVYQDARLWHRTCWQRHRYAQTRKAARTKQRAQRQRERSR